MIKNIVLNKAVDESQFTVKGLKLPKDAYLAEIRKDGERTLLVQVDGEFISADVLANFRSTTRPATSKPSADP